MDCMDPETHLAFKYYANSKTDILVEWAQTEMNEQLQLVTGVDLPDGHTETEKLGS